MKKIVAVFLFLVAAHVNAGTIWNKTHDIDRWTEKALIDAEGTTPKVIDAYSAAYKKWDVALNAAYRSLMKRLPERDKELLRDSQRKWVAYRDAEFKFQPIHLQRRGGTLSRIITSERRNNFIRDRVIELEGYIFVFDSAP